MAWQEAKVSKLTNLSTGATRVRARGLERGLTTLPAEFD